MRATIDFKLIRFEDGEEGIQINPVTGNQRLIGACNDVKAVIDLLGGVVKAAAKLDVEEIEIEHWIDDHYVPTRHANVVKALTGWSVWSIQIPPIGQFLHIPPVNYPGEW